MSAERQRWLAAIYEANFAVVVKRCRSILQSAEDAADAAHEVFLVALDSMEPETDEKRARSWLLTATRSACPGTSAPACPGSTSTATTPCDSSTTPRTTSRDRSTT